MIARLPLRLFAAATAWVMAAGCSRQPAAEPVAPGPSVAVRTFAVVPERVPVFLESPATVRPAERAVIAAKLTGTIASFPLGLGQAVADGEVLLALNAPEIEARLHQAEAQLAEAKRNADRAHTLVGQGADAPETAREAEDRLRYAQAAAAEAAAQFANATVRAPFAGVVTEKYALAGDLATPGLPLLALESTQHLRAEGSIAEKAAAGLHPGDEIAVWLDDAPAPVPGRLEEISGAADAVSRSVLVKVALPAGAARSGQFARLQVGSGTAGALRIPEAAVSRLGQIERVFVVERGAAVLRLVKVGRVAGGRAEILAGLNAGDVVVLDPPATLRDGQPVAVQP